MVLTSSTALLLLSLNTGMLVFFFLKSIWLPCWASLLPEHLLFVQVHAQSVSATYNYLQHVPVTYNCQEHVPPLTTVGNMFRLVITVENTFSLLITVGNRFLLVKTVENTFRLLITVGKNNALSFFLKKRGTSEMSSMGHLNFLMSV